MTKRITIIALLVAFVAVEANAQNRTHRRRGVILGGLAGAAIGAAIGDKGDNETAGALIGGAVGAVAGGTIGNQKDQRIDHNQRYHSGYASPGYSSPGYSSHGNFDPRYRQPNYGGIPHRTVPHYSQPYFYDSPSPGYPQAPSVLVPPHPVVIESNRINSRGASDALTPDDVMTMYRGGLSETVILQQIQIQGIARALTVREVIQLHQEGVSESIISAMQGRWQIDSEQTSYNAR